MPESEVLEKRMLTSVSLASAESSSLAALPMSRTISDVPEMEMSAAIAETEPRATRAVDARSILRIIFLPKRLIFIIIDDVSTIFKFTKSAIITLR